MDWSRFSPLSLSDFQRLFSRRTAILAFMAVVLYQATGIAYQVLTLALVRMKPVPAQAEKARTADAPMRPAADVYRGIAERNIFGTTTRAATEKQTAVPQQPDAALLIELKGTVAGGAKYGFAIVEEKATRKQRLVKAGDLITGAKVVRIKRNAIDLMINSQERTLKMAEMKENPIVPPPPAAAAAAAAPASPGTTVVNRREIEEGLEDMGSLLRQAQVRPYFSAGIPDGFIINSIRPGSLYRRMGLVDGDIIQEVNSRKIQTADDLMGLMNIIKSGASLSLTIRRRGNQETLNYQFQ